MKNINRCVLLLGAFIFALGSVVMAAQPSKGSAAKSSNSAPAATKASAPMTLIGKVDLRKIMLLHPAMVDYDPDKQAFKLKKEEFDEKKFKVETQKIDEQVAKLQAELDDILKKVKQENYNFNNNISKLHDAYLKNIADLATGPAGFQKSAYKLESGSQEAKHNARLTALYVQRDQVEEKMYALTKYSHAEGYTTPQETVDRFESMLKETQKQIKAVADQKGISVVLNSGFKRAMSNKKEKNNTGYFRPERTIGGIFRNKLPRELANDKPAVDGYYHTVYSYTQGWLREADFVMDRFNNSMMDSDILLGGVDLTSEVLTGLYKNSKLDANIAEMVIKAAAEY